MSKRKERINARRKQQETRKNLMILGGVVIAAVVLLVALSQLLGGGGGTATASLPKEITVSQAFEKYEAGTLVVDVRTYEEWNDFHAPDTVHIPLDELAARVDELPKDQEIVVICRSGNRSQTGRDILLSAGFEQVTSSSGGLLAWDAAGYPIVRGP